MSAAFHVASINPGVLVQESRDEDLPATLVDFMIRQPGSTSDDTFLSLLSTTVKRVENKIAELFSPSGMTNLIDTSSMSLSEEQLHAWREVVVTAPTASSIKFSRNVYLSDVLGLTDDHLIEALVSAMMYDKHGLLQLILYHDGREETRKFARKCIGEMRQGEIASRLESWLPTLVGQAFNAKDLLPKNAMREMADSISLAGSEMLRTLQSQQDRQRDAAMLSSLVRLLLDLGEAVERCELLETYASTSLYLFWAVDFTVEFLESTAKKQACGVAGLFVRNYVAYLLLLETEKRAAEASQ